MQTNPSATEASGPTCLACGHQPLQPAGQVKDYSVSGEWFSLLACPACGLKRTEPQPPPDQIGRYYASEQYISHSDTQAGLLNKLFHVVRKRMLRKKLNWVRQSAGMTGGRLLDVGAGTGYFAEYMQRAGWTVTALEPDEGARQAARERAGLDMGTPDALADLPPNSFDVITLWHVLEHVHAPDQYLAHFHRLLKDTGTLLIAVPNHRSRDAAHYGAQWAAWDVPRHLWHFSPDSMEKLLTAHGFSLSRRYAMPFDAYYVSMLSERYKGNHLSGPMLGAWNGLRTWIAPQGHKERASSLIYTSRKA